VSLCLIASIAVYSAVISLRGVGSENLAFRLALWGAADNALVYSNGTDSF
jgi:hypothetical protein